MLLRIFLTFALGGAACSAVRGTQPINIGSRLELMVDDYLIERISGGAELRLHRPEQREVVFTCDKPWEGDCSGLAVYIQDGDTYRMYYCAGRWPLQRTNFCYAQSKDGIQWTRPELGLVEFDGSKKNNIMLPGEGGNLFVPFKDANPNSKPEEQYKALGHLGEPAHGLYAYVSADGIHWRRTRDEPVITKGKFDTQNVAFWDTLRGRYVAFVREMRGPSNEIRGANDEIGPKQTDPSHDPILREGTQLGIDDKGPARDVMTCTSPDFLNWTEPQWLQYPGAPREQIYFNQIRPYYRAGHIFVGFPGRFMAGREIEKGLPITSHPSYKYGSITETLFMTSRDGVHFKRWGEAFIRPGPRKERWVYGATLPFYGLLLTKSLAAGAPDELSLYVHDGGSWPQRGKATRLRRYTLRIDGFVSVNAPLSGGEFVTKPLVFQGKELVMNFSTSAAGSVRVEIQTADGKPVEDFALADCPEIFGDQIEQVVTWKGGSDVSKLANSPIRLRFVIKDADLYSIRFRK